MWIWWTQAENMNFFTVCLTKFQSLPRKWVEEHSSFPMAQVWPWAEPYGTNQWTWRKKSLMYKCSLRKITLVFYYVLVTIPSDWHGSPHVIISKKHAKGVLFSSFNSEVRKAGQRKLPKVSPSLGDSRAVIDVRAVLLLHPCSSSLHHRCHETSWLKKDKERAAPFERTARTCSFWKPDRFMGELTMMSRCWKGVITTREVDGCKRLGRGRRCSCSHEHLTG